MGRVVLLARYMVSMALPVLIVGAVLLVYKLKSRNYVDENGMLNDFSLTVNLETLLEDMYGTGSAGPDVSKDKQHSMAGKIAQLRKSAFNRVCATLFLLYVRLRHHCARSGRLQCLRGLSLAFSSLYHFNICSGYR